MISILFTFFSQISYLLKVFFGYSRAKKNRLVHELFSWSPPQPSNGPLLTETFEAFRVRTYLVRRGPRKIKEREETLQA
jgi:hypothetical protein